jgi:L-threonylcarbamoyladenylate synthase
MALRVTVNREEPDPASLVLAAEVIQAGGIIVYPTETLYGIGANALNPRAVTRVHVAKRRDEKKPILVLVPDVGSVESLVSSIGLVARLLMTTFWPGPLTLVFRASARVPAELIRDTETIGIRVPSNLLCIKLLQLAECPLTSTSANISGQPAMRSIDEIQKTLQSSVDLYLDAGVLPESKPSTVVDVSGNVPVIIREGAITRNALLTVIQQSQG